MENSFTISFRASSKFFRIPSVEVNLYQKVSFVCWWAQFKGNDEETEIANNVLKDNPANKSSYQILVSTALHSPIHRKEQFSKGKI